MLGVFKKRATRSANGWALASAGASALIAAVSTAHAEQPATEAAASSSTTLSEVVVTATRRNKQSLLKVPLAVNSFSGETLKKYKVQSLEDLSHIDPSLQVESSSPTQQRIVIRGIASTTTQVAGMYLDEAPLMGGWNGNVAGDGTVGVRLHDLDHVEVLKGPQGTLFGAASMSGTLRVITKAPLLEGTEGSISGTYAGVHGGNPYWDSDFSFSAPIIEDKIGIRAVGWTEQGGGYIDDVLPNGKRIDDANDRNLYGGRLSALWDITSHLSLQVGALYQNAKVDGPGSSDWRVGEVGLDLLATPPDAGRDKYVNFDYMRNAMRDQFQLYTAVLNWDLGFGNIIASGSDGKRTYYDLGDTTPAACQAGFCVSSGSPPTAWVNNQQYHYDTGEIRFTSKFSGPLQMVLGAYVQHDRRAFYGDALVASDNGIPLCSDYFDCRDKGLIDSSISGPAGGFGDDVIFTNTDLFRTTQKAVYAQFDYKLLHNLTLTAGARYFSADLDSDAVTVFFPGDGLVPFEGDPTHTVPFIVPGPSHIKATQDKPTYNVALLYEPNKNWSIYGRVATGFRIGGVNVAATQAHIQHPELNVPDTYNPDTLTDYEIGTKLYLLNRKLYLDGSVYYIDWEGQQLGATIDQYNVQINAGRTTTKGVELSATFLPVEGLTIDGSITYVDAELAEDLPASVLASGVIGYKGDRIPYVPQWSGALRAEYVRPLAGLGVSGYLQGSATYRDVSLTSFRKDADPPTTYWGSLPSYVLLNARIGLRTEKYDVGLFVNNLTNTYAVENLTTSYSAITATTASPRTAGIQVSAHF